MFDTCTTNFAGVSHGPHGVVGPTDDLHLPPREGPGLGINDPKIKPALPWRQICASRLPFAGTDRQLPGVAVFGGATCDMVPFHAPMQSAHNPQG